MTEVTIGLAPLDSTDMGLVRSWRNDYRVWRWCRQNDLISDSEQVKWFNRQSEDPSIKMWKLATSWKDGEEMKTAPIGVCGLTSIDHHHKRAEFSLYLNPNLHGRGLGYLSLCVLLEHGFSNLGFNLIWGETFDGNPATRLFEKVGMVKEGTRRSFYWKDGKWTDAHLYSITREEWCGRAAGAVDSVGADRPSGLEHGSSDHGGLPVEAGQASGDCQRPSSGASPNPTIKAAKPVLAREKAGAKEGSRSRRPRDVASRAG